MDKPLILIADDEPDVLRLVSTQLNGAGFEVLETEDGSSALALMRERHPALAVLDCMMPGMTGVEVCRALKSTPATANIPVLLLTARASEIDRIVAFELGVDDYVTKPFSPRELVLRIKGILRRVATAHAEARQSVMQVGHIRLDADRHEVLVHGRPAELTSMEFKLLAALMENRGKVQSRETLLNSIWGIDTDTDSRTVDTHMRRLREKLGRAGSQLHTVRGFGYRMDES